MTKAQAIRIEDLNRRFQDEFQARIETLIETLSDALGIPYVYETGEGPTEMVFCTAQREIDGRACLLPDGHGDEDHVYARYVGGDYIPPISPEHGTYGPENDLSWVVTMLPDKYLRLTAGSVAALVRRVKELEESITELKTETSEEEGTDVTAQWVPSRREIRESVISIIAEHTPTGDLRDATDSISDWVADTDVPHRRLSSLSMARGNLRRAQIIDALLSEG